MAKKAPLAAAIALVIIVAVLFGGALLVRGEETEDGGGEEGARLPFATVIAAFLAFVAGYATRDALGRRAQRAARPPVSGRKTA